MITPPQFRHWWENPLWIWIFQGVVMVSGFLFVSYTTLWLNSHNDERYIKKSDYQKDLEIIKNASSRERMEFQKRLDRQDSVLDTISSDIKSLIRDK